ncbi:hypothetical protein H1230_20665 [Paenibacillus sp. 19GGS1-52]|uniref:hypothetical protein n=1 Tax=Paenibacillus sp. 19GGS1-52 TaxID=2758563 RepID=UPI001EFC16F0|nr:hypothetical protein [Paenibacillus sp. 19GGS1-52]ULO05483.1 hypothetical protein H1230_20665 [Paenibacillus sp. 19GGS1-52]
MAIQFLDSRVSEFSNLSTGTTVLPTTPTLLLGDIGLQVADVLATPNAADVRIELWGTIGVAGVAANEVTITVERGGTGVSGTGVLIYTAVVDLFTGNNLLSFHAVDFHPVVPGTGELRYSMYAADTGEGPDITITGPVAFSGVAQAGAF